MPFKKLLRSFFACASLIGLLAIPLAAEAQTATLLSQGRPAVASSAEGAFVAANAVDGNAGTRWGSAFTNNEWIYVDLGSTVNVSRVVLNWEGAYGSGYQIQVSANATTWTTIFTTTTGNGAIDDLAISGSGRYVRMLGTARATQWGYSLWEFQVFGTPASTATLLSQGRPAVASSAEAPFVAANAVDGNAGTRWGSAFTNNEWIYVDLGATATISRVLLNWEGAYGTGYQIQVSPNATSWTTIFTTTTGNGATDDLAVNGSGRYVRVLGTARATQWGYSLFEFQVFGTAGNNNCATLPGAPTGLSASGVNSTSLTLNWTAPNPGANCTITNYLVFRNGVQVASSVGTGTSALINGLTANTTYSFTVAAVNGLGTGPQSGGLSVTTPTSTSNQTSFTSPTPTAPGTFRASDYDLGGAGVAYNDISPGNTLGAYRPTESVDLEPSSLGGFNIGWVEAGDWTEYTINVTQARSYFLYAQIASGSTGGNFHFEFSGATTVNSGPMTASATGGWQTWSSSSVTSVNLNAGVHVVRLVADVGGFNIYNFTLDSSGTQPTDPVVSYPGYSGRYPNFTLSVDERFDGAALSAARWSTGDGTFPENNCRFQPQGVRVAGGNMEIVVRNEHIPASHSNDQNQLNAARDYSCGEARLRQRIQYGRIEGRFRTPQVGATGFVTSLFTYDVADFQWRELDIELEGGRPGSMSSNYIYGDEANLWFFEWQATRTWGAWERLHPTPRPTREWIVYAMEWTPDYVAWFMDGVEVRRLVENDVDGNPFVPPQIRPATLPRKPTTVMMNFWIPTPAVMLGFGGNTAGNIYPMVAQYDWFRFYTWTPGTPP